MKPLKISGALLLLVFIIAQFIAPRPPANQAENPGDLIENGLAEAEVAQLLKKSCYDCHSNQVNYPWYSNIVPVSLLVRHDILEGRDELNFSEWMNLEKRRKLRKLKEVAEVLEEDKMPLGIYTFIHREAKLSETDKALLTDWSKGLIQKTMKE